MVVPYKGKIKLSKKEQVSVMFDNISGVYDFLNHFLSVGIDTVWRRRAIRSLNLMGSDQILDVATGTGDFAIEAAKLNPNKIIGVDISEGMLKAGRKKVKNKGLENKIELIKADSENLPFEKNKFDVVLVAFGVRNFENPEKGLCEILRVVKPGGKVVILEFSKPHTFLLKPLYTFYFRFILPAIGRYVSRDKAAYSYLHASVQAFPERGNFVRILTRLGYKNTLCKPLTFGISSLYLATK